MSSGGSAVPRRWAVVIRRAAGLFITGAAVVAVAGCEATTVPLASVPPNFNAPAQVQPARPGTAARALPPSQSLTALPPVASDGSPRDWVPRVPVRKWHWIIIHHTATATGSLAKIDSSHRNERGWVNGAGYDFVIGNGTESRDGQIEVGPRWVRQIDGAHTHTPDQRFNKWGIGIVMVGNFDSTRPSRAQLDSTARLVAYLMKTYKVPPERVIGHRDAKATECPGRFTNVPQIRQLATRILADAGETIPASPKIALGPGGELMRDLPSDTRP